MAEKQRFPILRNSLSPVRTLPEMQWALDHNWTGYEQLRRIAKSRAPKRGNNDPRVDTLAVEIADFPAPFLSTLGNGRGGRFFPSIHGQMVVENGKRIGALPNGRRAGEPMPKNLDADEDET